MSDNLRRYHAIRDALKQLYPTEPKGRLARHLNTIAMLVSGVVGSQRVNLPAVAGKVPTGTQRESRVQRFERWLDNAGIDLEVYFLPFVGALLAGLAGLGPLVLVMDGSEVGRNCVALMLSVVYQGRALPLVWVVRPGKKGHFPEAMHTALLAQLIPLIPHDAEVVFLGDGEFDGVGLHAAIAAQGWQYVCRTATNSRLCIEGVWLSLAEVDLTRGQRWHFPNALFTHQGYGPVHLIAWWDAEYKEPIYLVTNLTSVEAACAWYRKRAHIETFFSDQKSRGFHLHKSHIANPLRLTRLLIAACLAYLWIIFLGALARRDGWMRTIHRAKRCDLSLFQLGLALLDHLLNEGLPIPVDFRLPLRGVPKSVR